MVVRLLAKQPTIIQLEPKKIFFFFKDGVRRLPLLDLPSFVNPLETWALIDVKQMDKTASIFLQDRSSLFVVVASSPRPSHWDDIQRYRAPIQRWFMAPFTAVELIAASVLLARLSCEMLSEYSAVTSSSPSTVKTPSYCSGSYTGDLLVTATLSAA